MKKLKLAVRFEIKEGKIVLFDKDGQIIKEDARWEGDFDCSNNKLTSLEGSPKEVGGSFYCYNNKLTSLEGAPKEVGGDFYCSNGNLTSLEGAPKEVGGWFDCSKNNLTSLEGAPKEVGGYFYCSNNELTSLEGAPKEVGGNFYCLYNNLTSLEGAPKEVGGDFICSNNELTSLEGAPKEVGGTFNCLHNKLNSLEGAPKEVGGDFYCSYNNLTSLEGAPKEIGGDFYCSHNKLTSLEGSPKEYQEESVTQRIGESFLKKDILWVDGIMSHLIKQRGTVFKVRLFGKKEESYVVTDGVNFSHGKTLKEAKEDLIFKVSKRDTEEFKLWNTEEKRGVKDLIAAYRSITGACSQGTKEFCKSIDLSRKYSVKEVIKMTENAFGGDTFKKFFK